MKMKQIAIILFAAAGGLSAGYFLPSHSWPRHTVVQEVPEATAAVAATTKAITSPQSPDLPKARAPSVTAATTARPDGNAEQIALRQRAEAGDGAAALQWRALNHTCSVVTRYSAIDIISGYFTDEESAPPEQPPFPQVSADEHAQLADPHRDLNQRRALADSIAARLHGLCEGYRLADDAERYAMAQIAARSGPPEGFWLFVSEPPFAADVMMNSVRDTAQFARMREWATQVPAMLQERAGRGDAESALVLGLAYALDAPSTPAGLDQYMLLYGAVDNDAAQAYRWISRYLRLAPEGKHAALARNALTQLATQLDPQIRIAIERE
ncbi:MAG: hypothetical protein JNN30_02360 [Rhodanobacteraceae bacterium]|nr:hypothetical protein [Rhodanobacteraceae bacterium]